MVTQAKLGYGTLLQYRDNGDWKNIAERVTIGGPSHTSDNVEVTNMDSPGGSKEYIPGLADTGEVTLEGNFIPGDAGQQQMLKDQKNRKVRDWRLVFPTAENIEDRHKFSFEAYVQNLNFNYPTQEAMTISATFKLAGDTTLAVNHAADLAALSLTNGVLTPTLTGDVYHYAATTNQQDTQVTAEPGGDEQVFVNGEEVVSEGGWQSDNIELSEGPNRIEVKVAKEDLAPRFYTIDISRI